MSMKNSSDTIENQTRDLPACSALPQLRHRVSPVWRKDARYSPIDSMISRNVTSTLSTLIQLFISLCVFIGHDFINQNSHKWRSCFSTDIPGDERNNNMNCHHSVFMMTVCVKDCLITLLTLRWLMSYIYGAPILDVSRSHTTTQHSR